MPPAIEAAIKRLDVQEPARPDVELFSEAPSRIVLSVAPENLALLQKHAAEKAIPLDFVRDVQILTGGYEAEFGGNLGSIVNVVTNSGGNDFHGRVTGFFSGDGLRAAGLEIGEAKSEGSFHRAEADGVLAINNQGED